MNEHDALLVHLEYIRKGIDRLEEGQRAQNGQLRDHGEDIARLQERSDEAKRQGRNWGAGAGMAGGFLGGFLTSLFKGS